ncbi:MAG: hypothetical protein II336_01470 [Loktanella sp.]|nr:hypothetical protein [Loktanella sp.]
MNRLQDFLFPKKTRDIGVLMLLAVLRPPIRAVGQRMFNNATKTESDVVFRSVAAVINKFLQLLGKFADFIGNRFVFQASQKLLHIVFQAIIYGVLVWHLKLFLFDCAGLIRGIDPTGLQYHYDTSAHLPHHTKDLLGLLSGSSV